VNDGWYTDKELEVLRTAAYNRQYAGHWVEIGVYTGRSAHVLAKEWTAKGYLFYLIDDMSLKGADEERWPTGDRIIHIYDGQFPEIGDVGLLHQDAGHDFETVYQHLMYWLPRTNPECCIALHDFHSTTYPDVRRAWLKVSHIMGLLHDMEFKPWADVHSLQIFERTK
jgi:hypothetical protein